MGLSLSFLLTMSLLVTATFQYGSVLFSQAVQTTLNLSNIPCRFPSTTPTGCKYDNYCFHFDLEFITKYSGQQMLLNFTGTWYFILVKAF